MPVRKITKADLLSSPASFLAFGFGTGLAPVAPGTFGTLPGLVLVVLFSKLPFSVYLWLTIVAGLAGIYFCTVACKRLQTHDHGGIVWDEIVGMLITMLLVPVSVLTLIAGFLLFRFFDIVKPWPIGWFDKKVSGGLGVMVDDVLAGLAACACLHGLLKWWPALV